MEKKIIGKNEVLFREGDLGDCFFLIEEGTAGIYLHYGEPEQQKLAEMKAGQFIGEMAVIEYWPRSTTVLAETELHLIEVKSGKLNDFFVEQPDRIMALMKQISMRIRTLTREYDEVCAFIREKQEARGENKESFLARMKKYRDHKKLADQLAVPTGEETLLETKDGAADKSRVEEFRAGQIVFREGDEGKYLYMVVLGEVDIWTGYGTEKQQKLTTLYTNDFFGEMGLIDREPRSATAVVKADHTALECIAEEDLGELIKTSPNTIDLILRHLSKRLRSLTADYNRACGIAGQE